MSIRTVVFIFNIKFLNKNLVPYLHY